MKRRHCSIGGGPPDDDKANDFIDAISVIQRSTCAFGAQRTNQQINFGVFSIMIEKLWRYEKNDYRGRKVGDLCERKLR